MGKTQDKARELLARTTAILDNPRRREYVHQNAASGLMTAEIVLEDVLSEDESGLGFSDILSLWEQELNFTEVDGL